MRSVVGAAALGLMASVVAAQPSPEFSREFNRVDRDARNVTLHLKCVTDIGSLVRKGVVTVADSSGAYLMCVMLEGRMVGLYVTVDSAWKRASRLAAFDPARGERITSPLDTADVITLMMSASRAVWALKDTSLVFFPPVAIRADSTIQVWLVPGTILPLPTPQVGGERHFVISGDGRKILRADSAPPLRVVPPPPGSSRSWMIETGSDSVPTFSEMLFANMLSMDGQAATFLMKTRIATLAGEFAIATWIFTSRKP